MMSRKRTMVCVGIAMAVGLAILFLQLAMTYMRSNYVDVSRAPEYASIVGNAYAGTAPMRACGITSDQNYKPPADHVVLMATPGFDGPEVLWCRDLARWTEFRVVGVKHCTNCLGGEDKVMVDVLPTRGYQGMPASLWAPGNVLSKDAHGVTGLNGGRYTLLRENE